MTQWLQVTEDRIVSVPPGLVFEVWQVIPGRSDIYLFYDDRYTPGSKWTLFQGTDEQCQEYIKALKQLLSSDRTVTSLCGIEKFIDSPPPPAETFPQIREEMKTSKTISPETFALMIKDFGETTEE